jgi:hypothetical protein
MKKRKLKCVDPSVGNKLALEIIWPISTGQKPVPQNFSGEPDLSPEVRQHLELCESCRLELEENLKTWYKKAASARKSGQAYAIVNASGSGDPTILRRNIKAGTALFKPQDDGSRGLVVLITPEFYINDPEERTLEEFNQMQ